MSLAVGLAVWTAFIGVIAVLAAIMIRGFVRDFRQGLREDPPQYVPLRTTLFRTVLVALLVLFLLMAFIQERQQRDQQWPASEGLSRLNALRSRGAPWIDDQEYDKIRRALLDAVDSAGSGNGTIYFSEPSSFDPVPAAGIARLRSQGWDVGAGTMSGDKWDYVALRTGPKKAILYIYQPMAWYSRLFTYLVQVLFAAALLSPFAAVAAWYLNRRIAKPVKQVADASVVLAEGGMPMPIPTKAPLELSVMAHSFNRMAAKLRKAQDTERDFLMSVGHELKTPLTAIDGYAELLQDEAVEPKRAAAVLTLESSRLKRLIGDLLDLARIGRSEFIVVDEVVDLAGIAREAVARFENLAATLEVELTADVTEPARGRGDHGRLVQVASNLVENALRATPSGGRVNVVARAGELSVTDSGPGLTEDDIDHAFERFYLHRKYADGPEVGTGLGLAIVKELVEAMGGSAGVTSEAGAGTTFVVKLPPPAA